MSTNVKTHLTCINSSTQKVCSGTRTRQYWFRICDHNPSLALIDRITQDSNRASYKWKRCTKAPQPSHDLAETLNRCRLDCSLCSTPSLVYPFDCIQQERQDIRRAEDISCGHLKNRSLFFSVMSRNVPDKVILVKSSFGDKVCV
ncbi:hypothetical protein TNCV_4398661 [Trichonephila clavipes]|nr:hypothetical protein TNCV_4398661 [Trichonephila clavipes]